MFLYNVYQLLKFHKDKGFNDNYKHSVILSINETGNLCCFCDKFK